MSCVSDGCRGFFMACLALACAGEGDSAVVPCTLDEVLKRTSFDAGVTTCEDPECVVARAASGEAFVFERQLQGIDSQVAEAMLRRSAGGQVLRLLWDSYESSGGLPGGAVSMSECTTPVLATDCAAPRGHSEAGTAKCVRCSAVGPLFDACRP